MNEHDPLNRQYPDEPRFVLLSRDPLAAGLTRLWAALVRNDASLARDVFANLLVTAAKLPYQPHKQTTHVRSALEIAGRMDMWLTERAQGNVASPPESP